MGSTTKFRGQFAVTPVLSFDDAAALRMRHADDEWDAPHPKSCCQWVPTKDRTGIEWDGEEKFYNYDKWLEYVAAYLRAKGYTLSGSVRFQGESSKDRGTLTIDNGVAAKAPVVPPPWDDIDAKTRTRVLRIFDAAMRENEDDDTDGLVDGLASAIVMLGKVR